MTARFTNLFGPFRQLRWKLTMSYTAVTVGALLGSELLLFGVALGTVQFILTGDLFPSLVAQEMSSTLAPELEPYLEQEPPDVEGIAAWLQSPGARDASTGTNLSIDSQPDSTNRLYVLDADKRLLGAAPNDQENALIGVPLPANVLPESRTVIDRALTGDAATSDLYVRSGERLIIVAPIRDTQSTRVLGVLIMELRVSANLAEAVWPLAQLVGISLVCLIASAGTIGTIFGFVTARGFSRRLKRLTDASDAWSQGRFSVYVEDLSVDEIGQLAARLNRMAQQLENLLDTRQELAIVEERNRLARELHDSAKQQAFAAAAQIGAAKGLLASDPEAAATHIVEAERLINTLRRELSTLILELRPAELANQGLAAALHEYVANWSRQTGIESILRVQSARALPLEIEQTLLRIAQEALANTARHSEASRVDVWLGYETNAVTLVIRDNGMGFDPEAGGPGFGLRSMRDRAQVIGGSLSIDSTPGHGTQITVTRLEGETGS